MLFQFWWDRVSLTLLMLFQFDENQFLLTLLMLFQFGEIEFFLHSSYYFSLVRSFTYTPHVISVWWGVSLTLPIADHIYEFFVHFARWIGENFLLQLHSSCWTQPGHVLLLYRSNLRCYPLSKQRWRLVWLRLDTDPPDGSERVTMSEHLSFFDPSSHDLLMRSFSYTPRAGFSQEFLSHSWC